MSGKTFKIGAGIALDGEKEFKQAVQSVNQDIRVLASEMKKVTSEFEDNGRSVKDLTAKQDVLERQLYNQTEKVKTLRQALQNSAREFGEADKKTKEWQISLNKAEAELSQTRKELDKTTKELNDYGSEAKQAAKNTDTSSGLMGKLTGAFALGGAAANLLSGAISAVGQELANAVIETMELADELMRLSAETGLSTDRLQELKYIGNNVGVSLDTVTSALKRLINNMGMAKSGTGEAYDAFEALHVKFRDDVSGELRDSNVVFNEIIDALGRMTNETERNALAQDLLGRSATELNAIIELGSQGINDMAQAAHDAGAVMSEGAVKTLDAFGDDISNFWDAVKAKTGEIIAWFATALFDYSDAVAVVGEEAESLGDKIGGIEDAYKSALQAAETSLSGQMGLWEDMGKSAGKTFGDIKSAIVSQIAWLQSYSENLANLNSRHIDGLDALLDKLADGTKESAAIVAGLASASDEQIQGLIGNMNEVEDRQVGLSRQLAEVKTDTVSQMNKLYSGMREAAKNQLDATDEATMAAINTMNGYISGILAKEDEVTAAYKGVAGALSFDAGNYQLPSSARQSSSPGLNSEAPRPININITPGAVNFDRQQVGTVFYDFTLEESDRRGNYSFGRR